MHIIILYKGFFILAFIMIKILQIHNSCLFFNEDLKAECVNDYHNYFCSLIYNVLKKNPQIFINIIVFEDDNMNGYDFKNNNKTIKLWFNYEHTLVLRDGRDTNNAPCGNILTGEKNETYLVRIDNYYHLKNKDIIIDYSIPNIENINQSGLFDDYSKKLVYIAPLLYNLYIKKNNREIQIMTSFMNTEEPRRHMLIDKIKQREIHGYINLKNQFSKNLEKYYHNTRIMINIHQTPHHHTFEELRVLPALCCGIIVICEESPLKEFIPYKDFVIWSSYDEILNVVEDVQQKYDFYWNKIFGDGKFIDVYNHLENNNFNGIFDKIHIIKNNSNI
jgi:hypothetical protein